MKFKIQNQMITRTDDVRIIEGDTTIQAIFEFSEDWDVVGKTAYFRNIADDHGVSMVLTPDRCKVPWEVLKKGFFTVTVYGGESIGDRKRITTNTAKIRVFAKGKIPCSNTPYNMQANTEPHI